MEEGKEGLEGGDGDADSSFVKGGRGRREERVRKRGKGGERAEVATRRRDLSEAIDVKVDACIE